jgi:beta propeller repeat protein
VWGNLVVWEAQAPDGGDISGMNLDTGERLDIEGLPGLQIRPQICGDILVWQDIRNGNWDVYGFSLSRGIEFPVSRQIDDQIMPSVSDSTVFWIDKRLSVDGVLGLRFGGWRSAADVRRFETLSQDGRISLLLDVDEHSDAIVYRFYRYPDDRPVGDDRLMRIRHEFSLGADSLYVYPDTSVAERRPFFYTLGVIDGYGEESLYGPVSGTSYAPAPDLLLLGHPFPNPCRGELAFNFGLPRGGRPASGSSWPDPEEEPRSVVVGVYTVTGRLIRSLEAGSLSPGYYRFSWDGRNEAGNKVGAGVYFISVHTGGESLSRKVILLR